MTRPDAAVAQQTPSLAHLPVGAFAIVMGLGGTAVAWERAHQRWGLPAIVGEAVAWLGLAVLATLTVAYALKLARHPSAVVAEWRHPVRSAFAASVAVAPLVLAVAMLETAPALSAGLWWVGASLMAVVTVGALRTWIADAEIQPGHVHPAWFIPVVGNLVAPLAGVDHAPVQVSWYFFGVGAVYWLGLLPVVLSRLFIAGVMPPRLAPTLAILVAPPAVGALAWVRLGGAWSDPLAQVLLAVVLLQVALLASQAPALRAVPFALSSWAYTFPLAAATVAVGSAADAGLGVAYAWIAGALLAATTVLVVGMAVRTGVAVRRRQICIPEG
ncbi:SLAC1 anion channel family protein [uncultured Demequina sp.]|uniref:SLAC1 anion channel family protein n=1 Tax=uncultured Demequina sp. TaxID=693499 RepID=UPI0025CF7109|nr:SLAC1 anion channel family protein [uncultured Demequina sp.]